MKAVIVPLVCLAIGAAGGVFLSKVGGNRGDSTGDSPGGSAHGSSTLGSSLGGTGSNSASGTSDGSGSGDGRGNTNGTVRQVSLAQLLAISTGNYTGSSYHELWRATDNLSAENLLQLVKDIEKLPLSDQRGWQLRSTVFTKLAQADPDGALAHARSITNRNLRQQALSTVLTEIANDDLGKSLKILRDVDDPAMFKQIAESLASASAEGAGEEIFKLLQERGGTNVQWGYNNLFNNWARGDFGAAASNFAELNGTQQRNYALQGLGRAITLENLDEGLAFAKTLSAGPEQTQFLGSVLSNLAYSDPQKALSVLDSHTSGSQRQNLIGNIASSWITSDPDSARAWIESLDNPRDKSAALQRSIWNEAGNTEWIAGQIANLPANNQTQNLANNLAQRWGQRDPKAAAEWVRTLPAGRARSQARQSLMNNWAQTDPVAAAAFFSEGTVHGTSSNDPFSNSSSGTAGVIAGQWVKTDPDAAIAWMDSLDASDNMRSSMLSTMVNQWSQADPKAAAAYVLELDGKERDSSISSLISTWARSDLDGAEAWVAAIDDAETRNRALGALIANSAGNDPQKAAATLATASAGLGEDEIKKNFASAANNIAHSWAQSDPTAAADWALGLPEGSNRPQVLQTVVNQWAQYEPTAASEWLTSFEPGPDRDGAVTGLVNTIMRDDPEAAFVWGASIDDEGKRTSSIRQTISHWRRVDSEAARAAIESSDLGEKLREQLLKEFPKEGSEPSPTTTTIHSHFYEIDPFGGS